MHERRRGPDRPYPYTRLGQALWLGSAVVFLALAILGLWLYVSGRMATERPTPRSASTEPSTPGHPVPAAEPLEEGQEPETDEDIVYYRRRNDRMEIALSFDDGPHPVYTREILSILEEYGVTATFFMVGENVSYYPDVAADVLAAGHEVGNHSYDHCRLTRLDESGIRDEVVRCEEALFTLDEYRPHLLRPPEGAMNEAVRRVAQEGDYRLILWDVDTRDWAHTPAQTIADHVLSSVQAGDIILMHDYIGHDSPTPAALRRLLPALLEQGYHFVTVSQLIDGDK